MKSMLVLNYMGQTAWLLEHSGETLSGRNPFYSIMPEFFLPLGIGIATIATVVASQALISGSFTLINEAIRLNLWPKVRISYPTDMKGQPYIPSINWLLYFGCSGVVLYFRDSSAMEAAYGMSIIIGMMMRGVVITLTIFLINDFSLCFIVLSNIMKIGCIIITWIILPIMAAVGPLATIS